MFEKTRTWFCILQYQVLFIYSKLVSDSRAGRQLLQESQIGTHSKLLIGRSGFIGLQMIHIIDGFGGNAFVFCNPAYVLCG